jgi:hypothetical protein
MPRVYTYKTRARTKHSEDGFYHCSKCGNDILPGQSRYEWSFRYGGTYRRHVDCGYPKQSELTQSKMGQVYAATEALEDFMLGEFTVDDLQEALNQAAEEVRQVASEYEEAAEHFGNQGENQERYEALDAYADEIEQVQLPDDQAHEGWEDEARSAVEDAISQCPY